MAYDLSPRLFLENGPATQAFATADRLSPTGSHSRAWVALNRERRLAAVEQALKAA
jgi:hypothetical protein